jgi:hypothetical protein
MSCHGTLPPLNPSAAIADGGKGCEVKQASQLPTPRPAEDWEDDPWKLEASPRGSMEVLLTSLELLKPRARSSTLRELGGGVPSRADDEAAFAGTETDLHRISQPQTVASDLRQSKYVLEDLLVGSGSIIGKGNIEEFFNHISMYKDVDDKSLAELAPSYEVAAAYLVHMLEARFVSLNPFMQQMFLKLHDIENSEKKDFILETLRREFRHVAIEARKLFEQFNMLGSSVNVVGTNKEDIKVPIPST